MKAIEYLIQQLNDPEPEAESVEMRKALCACAIRVINKVPGYSVESIQNAICSIIKDEEFINGCIQFIENAQEFDGYKDELMAFDD